MTTPVQITTLPSVNQTIATWRSRGRMAVPTAKGTITDVLIVRLFQTISVNSLTLDLLIEGQATVNAPIKPFGVIFSGSPLDWSAYGMPVLWMREGVGRWK